MESTSLLALPTELIQEIARQLDSPGRLSLRLVCRQMNAKTYHTFTDVHFTTRRHIFTEHSLNCLVSISQHPSLAQAVQNLELSLLPFEQRDRNAMHDPTSPFHVPEENSRTALTHFLDSQAHSHRSGKDVALLTRALTHLPNLRTLRIANEPSASWGYHHLGTALGWPAYMASSAHGASLPSVYGFDAALAAIQASAAAIHELDVAGGLPPSSLALPPAAAARLRPSMAHLRVLTLLVSLPLRAAPAMHDAGTTTTTTTNDDGLLALLPNLDVLRLGASRGRASNLDAFLAAVFRRAGWPRLRALHLFHLDARRDVLTPVLCRCAALEYLVLDDGRARGACWRPGMRYAATQHPTLVAVLCKRFEVLAEEEEEDGERSPFLEYDAPKDAAARHLVVDRENEWPRQQLPWAFLTGPEFWGKERVLFQMR